jgi:hypothetical protein
LLRVGLSKAFDTVYFSSNYSGKHGMAMTSIAALLESRCSGTGVDKIKKRKVGVARSDVMTVCATSQSGFYRARAAATARESLLSSVETGTETLSVLQKHQDYYYEKIYFVPKFFEVLRT